MVMGAISRMTVGWTFAKRPEAITLLDVYNTVDDAPIFALHVSPLDRNCPIGRGVQPALKKIYGTLEKQLRERLSRSTLAQVFADTIG
jgi:DNA-binding IscR family transcriptional regulator